MKNILTLAFVAISMTAFAQQPEVKVQQPVKKEFSGKHQFKKGKRFHKGEFMLKELDLTETQKLQMKEMKGKQRLETSQLRKKHQGEFQSILTKEQVQKLDQMKLEKQKKRAAFKSHVQQQKQ